MHTHTHTAILFFSLHCVNNNQLLSALPPSCIGMILWDIVWDWSHILWALFWRRNRPHNIFDFVGFDWQPLTSDCQLASTIFCFVWLFVFVRILHCALLLYYCLSTNAGEGQHWIMDCSPFLRILISQTLISLIDADKQIVRFSPIPSACLQTVYNLSTKCLQQ